MVIDVVVVLVVLVRLKKMNSSRLNLLLSYL